MKIEALIRDRYNREARLMPALLVALPAVLTLFVWFPSLRSLGPALTALLGFCGAIIWLSHLARDKGKAIEPRLYTAWGGMPSTAMLRHRDTRLPVPLKARYKAMLHKRLPDLVFPSTEAESDDPDAADAVYQSAGSWLLTQTREQDRFHLLFEENVNYGFRRNFRAMKPAALLIGVSSFVVSVSAASVRFWRTGNLPSVETAVVAGLVVVYALIVAIHVNNAWVQLAAEAFGRQLLAACDALPATEARAGKTRRMG